MPYTFAIIDTQKYSYRNFNHFNSKFHFQKHPRHALKTNQSPNQKLIVIEILSQMKNLKGLNIYPVTLLLDKNGSNAGIANIHIGTSENYTKIFQKDHQFKSVRYSLHMANLVLVQRTRSIPALFSVILQQPSPVYSHPACKNGRLNVYHYLS